MSALNLGHVAVCHGQLAADEQTCRRFWPLLDSSEQDRAARFVKPRLRHRYVECHGLARDLLSRHLNQAPARIKIQTTEYGKPYLPDFPDWTFNLSHSGDYFAIAIAQLCRIGIDIETIKARDSLPQLVEKCFAADEAAYWQGLKPSEQSPAFYRIWTAKEAFVKATGRGIAVGLERCATDPYRPERLTRIPPEYGIAEDWRLIPLDLPADSGVCGTLAIDQAVTTIDYHSWNGLW